MDFNECVLDNKNLGLASSSSTIMHKEMIFVWIIAGLIESGICNLSEVYEGWCRCVRCN